MTRGSTETIERDEESEPCSITLYVDGEEAYGDDVPGYQRTSLTVTETGGTSIAIQVIRCAGPRL